MSETGLCNTFWGSHGCDLPVDHEGNCQCGIGDPRDLCSEFHKADPQPGDTEGDGFVRYGGGGEWLASTWFSC